MIDLYYWTTPNGHKIAIFLEEAGLPYTVKPINISAGDQFKPDFLKISPNNRIPAIVDRAPADRGESVSVFESGAILLYLADKVGRFIPADLRGRKSVVEWLMWQMGGLGPMLGQNHHFRVYAPTKIPYAIERYVLETERLYSVLDGHLRGKEFVAGEYSIADMACYPWIRLWERQGMALETFPNLKRWHDAVGVRAAVQRAYELADRINKTPTITESSRSVLFGQGRRR